MFKKWLIAITAGASLFSIRAVAAETTDFNQGMDVKGGIGSLQVKFEMPGSPAGIADTFQSASENKVYAKGFIKKDLPAMYWQKFQYRNVQIPGTLDLRANLTQIENQGSCGSCWAFSLTATHRDGHALGGKDPGRLSQEWLVDNSTEAAGCKGGYFDSANDFVQPGGQPLWSACPYKQGSGKCAAALPLAAHITGWHMFGQKGQGTTVQEIEAYITATGAPVSIGVAAGVGRWQSYSGGIYNACASGELDHMINIVGWDNEGAAFDENGNLPAGKGIWILRNSWGKSWGENGYMRTKMTDAAGKRCNAVAEEAAYFDF